MRLKLRDTNPAGFRCCAAAVIVGSLLCAVTKLPRAGAEEPRAEAQAWIRVNRVGYLPNDPKIAVLSAAEPQRGTFRVGSFSAAIGPDCGPWGPFAHNYRLDFTAMREPGTHSVRCGAVESPPFKIGPDAYRDVPARIIEFFQLQRCGENPVTGEKCHQHDAFDAFDAATGASLDLVGGWHDAGDRIKHLLTTTYTTAALFLADQPEEAQHGAALVRKCHPNPDVVYVQIGDDRDHLPPERLWHEDATDYGRGAGGARAAWPATGAPEGPRHKNKSNGLANLAGRAAAAMALAGDVPAAESLYRLAQARPGCAMSVPVRAPYYYGESTYADDLEWAAVELFLATRNPQRLDEARRYAHDAGGNPWMGRDRHGHYEFFPYVNLAHWRLYPHVDAADQRRIAGYYREGLERIAARAQNPYRLGTPLVWCSTNNVVALATQAMLYEQMTGDRQFRALAAEARDWILGRNPWGVSLVIGVPSGGSASRPHHLFYKLKNHVPVGGLVDGPVYRDINEGLKFGASFADDPLARFQSEVGVYHDMYADFSTNEPIIDGSASLLLLLHIWK